MNKSENIKQKLSQALININQEYAQIVADSMTDIEVYATLFLKKFKIYQVESFNPYKPFVFFVGFDGDNEALVLTGNPENYLKLIKEDHVIINSKELAQEYVKTYLEVTRSMTELFYLVNSVDHLEFRDDLTPEEALIKETFIKSYQQIITETKVESDSNLYRVIIYIVLEQSLNKYLVTVNQMGDLEIEITILEEDLPLVYGL